MLELDKTGNVRTNIALKHPHETTVAVEKQ